MTVKPLNRMIKTHAALTSWRMCQQAGNTELTMRPGLMHRLMLAQSKTSTTPTTPEWFRGARITKHPDRRPTLGNPAIKIGKVPL